ncbi:MAG: CinA family nicotinamide mononucleotide deamidase-related protein [Bacteriovoracaceae bacterium]|nr:CinA family nicotinamide mononucleotide deamidase-related protein [Bacteriovoracaceae bacterium]
MKLELIIIGNELLQGKVQEINGHWLAGFLANKKIELSRINIIKDDSKLIQEATKRSLQRAEIVLLTGGLGPTEDDLTKQALTDMFSKKLIVTKHSLDLAKEHYQRIGRNFEDANTNYEKIPEDFFPIRNHVGLAPGLRFITADGKLVLATPGVPREFYHMFEHEIYPYIEKNFEMNKKIKKILSIRTKDISEEKIFSQLCPHLWADLSQFGYVSSLPQILNVDIGVQIEYEKESEFQEKQEKIKKLVNGTKLKEYIWHWGDESLEQLIVENAKAKKIKFGFAESCTGGLNSERITNVSGSSSVFWGSVVSYSNEIKTNILKVNPETIRNFGAVSEQTAIEMAQGAVKELGIDIAISSTGIAGPTGGSEIKPVGTIVIGHATKNGNAYAQTFHLHGDRVGLKRRFSQKALFELLEQINRY